LLHHTKNKIFYHGLVFETSKVITFKLFGYHLLCEAGKNSAKVQVVPFQKNFKTS